MAREYLVRVTPQQSVEVYSPRSWRLRCYVGKFSPTGADVIVERSYPTWDGHTLPVYPCSIEKCDVGSNLLFLLGASSLLPYIKPFLKPVEITVVAVEGGQVTLRIKLPRWWRLEVEETNPVPEDVEQP